MQLSSIWKNSLNEASSVLNAFTSDSHTIEQCEKFTELLVETFKNNGNVFSCGNGGSHCDAMHFAEEFTGRFRGDRQPLGALALGDASHVTCVSNDFGFEHIFSRQLQGLGREGDLLIGLSTSGNSSNVIDAFQTAKSKKIKTVALLGKGGGKLKELADVAIVVPQATTSDRIQEVHIKVIHTVIEATERMLFPENY
ncbi:MAG: D-sedoheptulose 7-phosphate isomerase [Bdellovibrionales bacterium]|nr:D-sedoheptulose 7-phosphate isomerase [Bdellovibrionales bacterium]